MNSYVRIILTEFLRSMSLVKCDLLHERRNVLPSGISLWLREIVKVVIFVVFFLRNLGKN